MSDPKPDSCADFRQHLLEHEEPQRLVGEPANHVAHCDACADLYASLAEVDLELSQLAPIEAPAALVASALARLTQVEGGAAATPEEAQGEHVSEPAASPAALFHAIGELVLGGFAKLFGTLFWPLRLLRRRPAFGSGLLVAGAALSGLLVFGAFSLTRRQSEPVSEMAPSAQGARSDEVNLRPITDHVAVEGAEGRLAQPAAEELATASAGATAPAAPVDLAGLLERGVQSPANDSLLALLTDGEQTRREVVASDQGVGDDWALAEDRGEVAGDSVVNGQASSDADFSTRVEGQRSPRARAEAFLRERERVDGLRFQAARGHFSNSYVPGDPALRSLRQRLVEAGGTLGSTGATGLELAEAANVFSQPLDPPRHASLALSVRGDQRASEGPRRMLVQVGIRAAARRGGRRPALNVGVLLDLSRPLGAEEQAQVTALLEALSASRDVGDRVSLQVAGPRGGGVIEAGSFRHGQVQVAVDQLFHGAARSTPVVALSLDAALRSTLSSLAREQGPSTPLGSSFLLVVTPGLSSSPALQRAAHVGAVAGIPTSVVGLGAAAVSPLDALALAGQGRRRLLGDASEAAGLVRAEFDAVSQVVARAIRLRIRLAPGTRLVRVLDSHRLDVAASARVREAERSIDQRLARSLGIQADRDEDTDGIRIFIPAFYANDSHVILLDVVASGPGPVAEVSARYKDLLHLRNGEARASLRLARGGRGRGPLERAVLKNLLAQRLARALAEAATLVRSGRGAEARVRLTQFIELSRGVQELVPAFRSDHELAADLSLALSYDVAIRTSASPQQVILADSLRLASRRKALVPMFTR